MEENKRGEFQTERESLHWISYNLKNMAKELKNMTPLLAEIRDLINVPSHAQKPSFAPPVGKRSEEIPF